MVTRRRTHRNAEANEALHDHLPGHGAHHRAGNAGGDQRSEEDAGGRCTEQRRQRMVGSANFGHVAVTGVEGARGHDDHRDIHQPGERQRDHHLNIGETQQLAPFAVIAGRAAVLGQPECRKMACGITVAPIMPTAMVSACASGNCGVTMPIPAACQSTGTMNISTR